MHEKSIQEHRKINARKRHAKSMENDAKMESKRRPKSLENLKICERQAGVEIVDITSFPTSNPASNQIMSCVFFVPGGTTDGAFDNENQG